MKNSLRKITSDLLVMSRILEWGVHLLVFIVIALSCYTVAEDSLHDYLFFLGVTCIHYSCILFFTYLLNDWTDRKEDLKQGKKKKSREFSRGQITTILTSLLIIGVGSILYVHQSIVTIILVASQFIVATIYSLGPVRLKERGIWGILVAAIFQRVPVFIIFAILVSINTIVSMYICIWLSLLGFIFIFEHQIEDWHEDQKYSVTTYLVTIGIKVGSQILRWIYLAFLLSSIIPVLNYFIKLSEPITNVTFVIAMTLNSIIAITLFRFRYCRTQHQVEQDEY